MGLIKSIFYVSLTILVLLIIFIIANEYFLVVE